MTNVNAAAASSTNAAGDAPKRVQAFYSQKDAAPVVSLWLSEKSKATSPDFDGTIDGKRVFGYVQKGAKGGFVSFKDSEAGKDEATGHYKNVATGNVVANGAGIPKLVLNIEGSDKPVWVECSLKLSQDMLVGLGLDLDKQAANKASHAAKKAAEQAAA